MTNTIKRYDETRSHEDHHRKGRPRVTSAAEDKLIRVNCTSDCRATLCLCVCRVGEQMISACVVPPLSMEVWWCWGTLLLTVSVVYFEFKAHLTSMGTTTSIRHPIWFTLSGTELVCDELDLRLKENQHMWELLQDCWKGIPGEAGWENAKSVESCHQDKAWLLWRISNIKYILINPFLVTTWLYMCYFIILMSSLLFYNAENSTNKENPLNV